MSNNDARPVGDIAIYRLDIYRLLTLFLADKQITETAEFREISYDFFEGESNRLKLFRMIYQRGK